MRFSKKMFVVALVVMFGFATLTGMGWASDDIAVTIDGIAVDFDGQGPVIVDNRVLVPVRGVFEALGFVPTWNRSTRAATLTRDDYVVVLTIGSYTFTTNGEEFPLDVPPQLIEGRTLLPLRAVLESVGYNDMSWSGTTRTVVIRTQPVAASTPAPTPAPSQIEDFVGTWVIYDVAAANIPFFVFRADGTGSMDGSEIGWTASNGIFELCTTPWMCRGDCWAPSSYDYILNGDFLELSDVLSGMSFAFLRTTNVAPAPTPTPTPAPRPTPRPGASTNPEDIVGIWAYNDVPILDLRADGTGTLHAFGFIGWTVENGILFICITPHSPLCQDECWLPEEWYFEINGDELTLFGITEPGAVHVFTRR